MVGRTSKALQGCTTTRCAAHAVHEVSEVPRLGLPSGRPCLHLALPCPYSVGTHCSLMMFSVLPTLDSAVTKHTHPPPHTHPHLHPHPHLPGPGRWPGDGQLAGPLRDLVPAGPECRALRPGHGVPGQARRHGVPPVAAAPLGDAPHGPLASPSSSRWPWAPPRRTPGLTRPPSHPP